MFYLIKNFINLKYRFSLREYTQDTYFKIYLILLSLIVIFTYIVGFYGENGDVIVYTNDNLDSNVAFYKILQSTNTFFSSNETLIPNIINGLPRAALASELNVVSLLYYFFEPKVAYIVNELFIRLIAFFGMLLLLKRHFFKADKKYETNEKSYDLIMIGIALVFALLPYWSNGGASIAGQPLVLYAFLNIREKDVDYKNWLILCMFPFYSSLILAGIFVLFLLMVITIYDIYHKQEFNFYLLLALVLMSGIYLCVEYRLIINMIDPVFVSHREEFSPKILDFHNSMIRSTKLFLFGQYHAHSIHSYYLLPMIFFSIVISVFNHRVSKYLVWTAILVLTVNTFYSDNWIADLRWKSLMKTYVFLHAYVYYIVVTCIIGGLLIYKKESLSFWLLTSILLISIFSGFEDYKNFQFIKEVFPLLKKVQFDRFYFILPTLWFMLFALSSKMIFDKTKYGLLLVVLVLLKHGAYSISMQNAETWRKPKGIEKFYSKSVYSAIEEYIGLPVNDYRVMSIGLYPSIAMYNGFFTLDAYLPTYPLEYKHEFRKIIAQQLEKSKKWKVYFDHWGSRCRLMDSDKNLTLNLEQFKQMGGRYIFAGYEVNINEGNGIKFLKKFKDNNSLYTVYLYQVQ